jgi:hypothetical protein
MMLGEYLKAPRPRWDWVNLDCSRWLDAWIVLCGHPSPMVAIDIRYDSERSALRTIARGGGLLALWSHGMEAAGLHEASEAMQGDAAILSISTDDGTNQTCGIWTGARWASLHQRGLMFGVGAPLKTWRVAWAA